VGSGPFVQRLGRQIDAAGPRDGSRLGIDRSLIEVCRVVERFEHASPSFDEKSVSPTVPPLNSSRRTRSRITAAPTATGR
jgi:hypothetical protein